MKHLIANAVSIGGFIMALKLINHYPMWALLSLSIAFTAIIISNNLK